jgi:hypothetical protein
VQGAGYIKELIKAAKEGRPIVLLPPEEALRVVRGELRFPTNVILESRRAGDDPEHGEVIDLRRSHNLVTAGGRDLVRDMLLNFGPAPGYIALGTGVTVPADGNTALEAEVFRSAITRRNAAAAIARFKLFVADTEANGSTLSEAGLFSFAPTKLFARTIFAPIVKDSSVQFTITWDILLSS